MKRKKPSAKIDENAFSVFSAPKSFLSVVPQAGVEQLFMVYGVPKGHE
jgi:hypothetical protein